MIWEAGELVPTNAQTFSEAHSHLGVSYDGEVDRGPQRGGGISVSDSEGSSGHIADSFEAPSS